MSDTAATLSAVVIGAVLGFLASIGFSIWQERRKDAELRARLKDELQHIRSKIQSKIERNEREPEAYFIEFFQQAKPELVVTIDAKTWEGVIRAYQAIESLKVSDSGVQSANHYSEVQQLIDYALAAL